MVHKEDGNGVKGKEEGQGWQLTSVYVSLVMCRRGGSGSKIVYANLTAWLLK